MVLGYIRGLLRSRPSKPQNFVLTEALPKKPHSSPEHRRARIETWKALEDLYRPVLQSSRYPFTSTKQMQNQAVCNILPRCLPSVLALPASNHNFGTRQGIVRAIGVSNFTDQHLQQLEEAPGGVVGRGGKCLYK